mgnify:FL=1
MVQMQEALDWIMRYVEAKLKSAQRMKNIRKLVRELLFQVKTLEILYIRLMYRISVGKNRWQMEKLLEQSDRILE